MLVPIEIFPADARWDLLRKDEPCFAVEEMHQDISGQVHLVQKIRVVRGEKIVDFYFSLGLAHRFPERTPLFMPGGIKDANGRMQITMRAGQVVDMLEETRDRDPLHDFEAEFDQNVAASMAEDILKILHERDRLKTHRATFGPIYLPEVTP